LVVVLVSNSNIRICVQPAFLANKQLMWQAARGTVIKLSQGLGGVEGFVYI